MEEGTPVGVAWSALLDGMISPRGLLGGLTSPGEVVRLGPLSPLYLTSPESHYARRQPSHLAHQGRTQNVGWRQREPAAKACDPERLGARQQAQLPGFLTYRTWETRDVVFFGRVLCSAP
jgi:hypothetical protein